MSDLVYLHQHPPTYQQPYQQLRNARMNPFASFNANGVPYWENPLNSHSPNYIYERQHDELYYMKSDGSEDFNRSFHYFPPYDQRINPLTHSIYRKYVKEPNGDLDKTYIYEKPPGERDFSPILNTLNGGGRRTHRMRRTHRRKSCRKSYRKSYRKSRSHRKRR